MNYKFVVILSDLSNISLYKVPLELYNRIENYLNKISGHGFPDFQKLYDNLCKDDEDIDKVMEVLYRELENCEEINCNVIQVY